MTTGEGAAKPQVHIGLAALAVAEVRAIEALPIELGGIIVGWWERSSTAFVTELLLVPDYTSGRTHYVRKHSRAQEVLDEHVLTHDDPRCGYIGEWHTHPAPVPPSAVDRRTLTGIVRHARGPIALLVLAVGQEESIITHALIGRPSWPRGATITPAQVERMES